MKARFFNWLETRLAEYDKNRAAAMKAHATRWAQVAAKRNNGDLPTISGDETSGYRMHAPYDGYLHVWTKADQEFEREFLGGQYLPYDSESFPYFGSCDLGETNIFDVPADRADRFQSEWDEFGTKVISVRVSRNTYTREHLSGPHKVITVSRCPEDIRSAIDTYIMGDIYKLRQLETEKLKSEQDARDELHRTGEEVTEGRQVITGMVLTLKWQSSDWGDVLKMLVQDDRGFRVWGSVPRDLELVRGDRIQFTGTIKQSDRDTRFGFFKRPTKAINLSSEEGITA